MRGHEFFIRTSFNVSASFSSLFFAPGDGNIVTEKYLVFRLGVRGCLAIFSFCHSTPKFHSNQFINNIARILTFPLEMGTIREILSSIILHQNMFTASTLLERKSTDITSVAMHSISTQSLPKVFLMYRF